MSRTTVATVLVLMSSMGGICLGAVTTTGSINDGGTSSSRIYVGDSGDGTLGIDSGSILTRSNGYIGCNFGSTGTATITGTGSTWTNSGTVYVGYGGIGVVTIQAGGQVSSAGGYLGRDPGSTGTVTVTGAGSTWTNSGSVYVGGSGSGVLSIQSGGKVSSSYSNIWSTGSATVTGTGSTWTNSGNFYVGSGGGKLTVADGGLVTTGTLWASLSDLSGNGTIATTTSAVLDGDVALDATHGLATVPFGTGGTLNLTVTSGMLGVGYKGAGTLQIAGGITVASGSGYLGYNSGSTGTATVTGVGSTWTSSGDFYVGYQGSGKLTVANGGQVTAGTLWASPSDLSGNGTITVQGAVLDADMVFDSTHGATAVVAFGTGGTLSVQTGGTHGAGYKGAGTLRIAEGVTVTGTSGILGYNSGSTGTATVTDAGSAWTNSASLWVGFNGNGALRVQSGGQVSDADGCIGYLSGSTGTATVTGNGSKWTNSNSLFVGDASSGTLKVEAGGQVTSSYSNIGYGTGTTGTATISGVGSSWNSYYGFNVGYSGAGTLNVQAGGQISDNTDSNIGYKVGSIGTVTVTGSGSVWTKNYSDLWVGVSGKGALNVQNGGQVSDRVGYIGSNSGSVGTATVSGAGATWTNSDLLYVGHDGSGKLTIADGGKVTTPGMSVYNSQSAVRLNVSGNGMLVLGNSTSNGGINNSGTVSFYANAFLTKGTYTPVSAYPGKTITWSGTGSYKAVGGVWDNTAKTFSVTDATPVAAGVLTAASNGQRMVITDSGTNNHVGASFGSVTSVANFSASLMNDSELAALAQTTGFAGSVLSGWDFNTNLTGNEVMLAFDIGTGAQAPAVWHYSNGLWAPYTSDMQTYDANGILSFTATDFAGGYAVTATPEPATLALLALGGLAMLRRQRR